MPALLAIAVLVGGYWLASRRGFTDMESVGLGILFGALFYVVADQWSRKRG
jgi:hypothetical protein